MLDCKACPNDMFDKEAKKWGWLLIPGNLKELYVAM
jgi:hypothetical protein